MDPQRRTALVSVGAAVALIALKLGAGLAAHSLGLVSEAAHSGTDLIAALLTFFGVTPDKFSCNVDSSDCKFNFNYTASNRSANRPRLLVRHWQDRGKGAGSMLQEVFHGDIADS